MFCKENGGGRRAREFGSLPDHCAGAHSSSGFRHHILPLPTVRSGIVYHRRQCCKYTLVSIEIIIIIMPDYHTHINCRYGRTVIMLVCHEDVPSSTLGREKYLYDCRNTHSMREFAYIAYFGVVFVSMASAIPGFPGL